MMADPRPVASTTRTSWRIALIAFLARLASFTISLIANITAADYDTSAGLQRLDCGSAATASVPLAGATAMCTKGSTSACLSVLRWFADSLFQSKVVWDSVFFNRIALCGYEYEQFYAFFPLLPG